MILSYRRKISKVVMISDTCHGSSQVTSTEKIHLDLDEGIFPVIEEKWKGLVIYTSIRLVTCQVSGNVILHITETNS